MVVTVFKCMMFIALCIRTCPDKERNSAGRKKKSLLEKRDVSHITAYMRKL